MTNQIMKVMAKIQIKIKIMMMNQMMKKKTMIQIITIVMMKKTKII